MRLWHAFIHPVTRHFRQKRGKLIKECFPSIENYRICDLGGSRHFWDKLAIDVPYSNITIYNVSHGETQSILEDNDISVHLYDGQHIPVPDGYYDLVVCNSVLEHVPPEQRKGLIDEMRRVGKHLFLQTPAYEFPIEPHFIMPFVHWLPRKLGYWFIHVSPWRVLANPSKVLINESWWSIQLLTLQEMRSLFPLGGISRERFFGLTKSYYVII